ncbi:MAG: alpha/beta hydrolase [Bacteroidales bacterium]|nr:alpha/beta hydrolase [Bacteroidales bacterium]
MTNFDRIFPLSLLYIVWLLIASCSGGEIAPAMVATYLGDDGNEREMDVFVDSSYNHYFYSNYTNSPRPAILYFHGGSWISGTRAKIHQRYREPMLQRLVEKGFIVFSVDYRLVGLGRGHLEGVVSDCRAALFYVVDNADALGVDTSRIGLWGSSAGAHLAMMTAFADTLAARRVKFLIDDFGPVDIHKMFSEVPEWGRELISDIVFDIDGKSLAQFDSLTSVYSPINYNTNIPVLIFHGEDDNVVDISQSRMLYSKLLTNSKLVSFTSNGHGLKNLDDTQLKMYMETFEEFVDGIWSADGSSAK